MSGALEPIENSLLCGLDEYERERGGMLDASTLDGSMNRVIRLVMSV